MLSHAVSIGSIDLREAKWRQNGGGCRKGFVGSEEFLSHDLRGDRKGRYFPSKIDTSVSAAFEDSMSEPKIALSPETHTPILIKFHLKGRTLTESSKNMYKV